eukprot:CAMPEP_0197013038 /NCGR_PEP_ID=MMETSP1380-20130617/64866_1 /TAXON_ID=5936 /ORGANISM="Euplotes crassus, Strain CT5" /LENGTH=103 /DNA_ID=CAMNT_0042437013 /DNA_START=1128 /DNA_END=1439 /DNA_ORIENTATION=-
MNHRGPKLNKVGDKIKVLIKLWAKHHNPDYEKYQRNQFFNFLEVMREISQLEINDIMFFMFQYDQEIASLKELLEKEREEEEKRVEDEKKAKDELMVINPEGE